MSVSSPAEAVAIGFTRRTKRPANTSSLAHLVSDCGYNITTSEQNAGFDRCKFLELMGILELIGIETTDGRSRVSTQKTPLDS
jgi:hypothetical protein